MYPHVEIKSYIKQDDGFVGVDNFNGPVLDSDYIEGAIELSIYGKKLITKEHWDDINWLWCDLVNGLSDFSNGNDCVLFFPSQPIKVELIYRAGGMDIEVAVSIAERNSVQLPIKRFLAAVLPEGEHFFNKMLKLDSKGMGSHTSALRQLAEIRQFGNDTRF